VPESVSEFLTGVWLRHLRTAVLRDGEESAGYKAALKVVDDLLWTIDGEGQRRSRSELAQRIPEMLKILTQGISDIGAKPEDYRPFFDEMFLIHLRRMQKRRKPGDGAMGNATSSSEEDLPVLSDLAPGGGPAAAPGATVHAAPERAAADDALPVPAAPVQGATAGAIPGAATAAPSSAPGRAAPVATGSKAQRPAGVMAADRASAAFRTVSAPAEPAAPAADPPSITAAPAASPRPAAGRRAPAATDHGAQSASELKLRRLIDETSLDDAPRRPVRMELAPADLARDLAPGQWLEMITSKGRKILAKVAWINERRSVVLLLQHPDRLILSRHVAAIKERAERKRVFRVR
jgi:hypothetical protein